MRLRSTRIAAISHRGKPPDPFGRTFLANAATGLLASGFTYTRSGPDLWCPQDDGSYKSFAANVIPREFAGGRWGFRFDPGWTQVARFTHELSNAAWSRSALLPVVSGALGVNGQADSFALIEDTTNAIHFLYQTYSATSGQSYTHKYILAPHTAGQPRLATIFMGGPAFNADCWLTVNPATGEKVAQGAGLLRADVEQLAGGYWSVSVSATAVATNAGAWHSIRVHPVGTSYLTAHTGDGVSGVRCYAVNFTNTAYPVPLTVAQGTAVTVGAANCTALLSGLGVALGTEYTVGMDYTALTTATDRVVMGLSSGAFANSIYVIPRNGSGNQSFAMLSGNVPQLEAMSGAAAAVGAPQKSSLRAKQNDSRASINGVLASQDTACVLPVGLTNIRLGGAPWGGAANDFAGHIHKLWLAPSRALTDAELQAVTA